MPDRTEIELQELREEIRRLREERNGDGKPPQPPKPEPEPPKRPFVERTAVYMRTHPVGMLVGLVVVAIVMIGGYFLWRYLESYESTDDARVDGHVNPIATRVSGTVTKVYVVENQMVKQGDLLLELDPRDYSVALERAKASLGQAQAAIVAGQANIPITSTTTQTTIETARSEVANAQASLAEAQRDHDQETAKLAEAQFNNTKAQADLARYRMLVAKDEVSHEEFDQRVAAAEAAAARVRAQEAALAGARKVIDQRRATVETANARFNQAQSNAPQQVRAQRAGVDAQRAQAEAARAALNEASLNLGYTKVYSPVAGIVGRRAVEAGQRVQAGQQLLSVVQVDDIWVTANFKENQLRHMRAGQRATIHVDAFDRDFDGYVESMPGASAATFSVLPPENASGNYVKVVQRLPVRLRFKPGQDPNHQLRPGMSAEPKVWLE